jgi:hypothetical protein
MLDISGDGNLGMLALFVDWHARRRKGGIGECVDRDGDGVKLVVDAVVDRGAALRTEVKHRPAATVAGPGIFMAVAREDDVLLWPTRLGAEDAPRALLARQAMTDRYPDWLAVAGRG